MSTFSCELHLCRIVQFLVPFRCIPFPPFPSLFSWSAPCVLGEVILRFHLLLRVIPFFFPVFFKVFLLYHWCNTWLFGWPFFFVPGMFFKFMCFFVFLFLLQVLRQYRLGLFFIFRLSSFQSFLCLFCVLSAGL